MIKDKYYISVDKKLYGLIKDLRNKLEYGDYFNYSEDNNPDFGTISSKFIEDLKNILKHVEG